MPNESTVRFEMKLPASLNDRLKALLEKSKARSMSEMFRNAIAIYEA